MLNVLIDNDRRIVDLRVLLLAEKYVWVPWFQMTVISFVFLRCEVEAMRTNGYDILIQARWFGTIISNI